MRYLRFQLRSLLIVVLVIALPLGWATYQRSLLMRDERFLTKFAKESSIELVMVGPLEGSVGVTPPANGGAIVWRDTRPDDKTRTPPWLP